MPSLVGFAGAASAGRVVPAKPTLTHHTITGQFQITNYDANLTYNLSVTAGTATRSGDIITLSNANSVCTVTARRPKSVSDSAAATCERKAITQSYNTPNGGGEGVGYYFTTNGDSCAPPVWVFEDLSGNGSGPFICRKYELGDDPTPSGYTKSYGEWWRVT